MRMRMMRRLMGILLLLSMLVTTALLVVQGRWQEAIPLHLCSVSALLAAVLSFKKSPAILDFLWYLGMPGAVLALIFPAPASSVMQPLFTAGYVVTHALIAAIPLIAFAMGEEPRRGTAPTQLMALQPLALTAFFVNRALGTDFLFLAAPPQDTPLTRVWELGYPGGCRRAGAGAERTFAYEEGALRFGTTEKGDGWAVPRKIYALL